VTKVKLFIGFSIGIVLAITYSIVSYGRPLSFFVEVIMWVISKTTGTSLKDLGKYRQDIEIAVVVNIACGLLVGLMWAFPKWWRNLFAHVRENKLDKALISPITPKPEIIVGAYAAVKTVLENKREENRIVVKYKTEEGDDKETLMVVYCDSCDVVSINHIAEAVNTNNVMIESRAVHYRDRNDGYHVNSLFQTLQILKDSSIGLIIKSMAKSVINPKDVWYVLYINKRSEINPRANEMFAQRLRDCLQDITQAYLIIKSLSYDSTGDISLDNLGMEKLGFGELRGRKVIIVESLLIYPYIINDVTTWLRTQAALIHCIIILIDGTFDSKFTYKNAHYDVIIGASIDLGLKMRHDCRCRGTETILDYNGY
jgi:hypothetical protein